MSPPKDGVWRLDEGAAEQRENREASFSEASEDTDKNSLASKDCRDYQASNCATTRPSNPTCASHRKSLAPGIASPQIIASQAGQIRVAL